MTRKKSVRAADEAGSELTFARKLDRLFQSVRPPGGGEYTYAEVSAGIAARGVATISDTYLCDLRNGTKENPRIRHVEALADFFGVPISYFLDGDESARLFDQLETLPAAANASVRRIALRAVDLSPETLEAVAGMIERARQMEGLKDRRVGEHDANKS
jgi:transcriptional regulator with XRE-family HTH domain